jgi:hypothetical protein
MSSVTRALAKAKNPLFACTYSPKYESLIKRHVLSDSQHPLNHIRKRLFRERERTGLWWDVTFNSATSKTKVVRNWMRRRLEHAFIEELEQRGIGQDGKLIKDAAVAGRPEVVKRLLEQGKELSIKGSVKLHMYPPLVTANFVDVKDHAGKVADALLESVYEECDQTSRQWSRKQPLAQPQQQNRTPMRQRNDRVQWGSVYKETQGRRRTVPDT